MNIQLTDLAAAKLRLLILEEENTSSLAIHVALLTSGCNTPSFGLEVIEPKISMERLTISNIPFVWYTEENSWLPGIFIDLNRENGKFVIVHPDSSLLTNCTMIPQGDDSNLGK